jgi:diaminohydroxyphosphoribosylaminopyrimidine deaminase/5-amino-6-(5-phosphoribosylamino)uracil reductase
MQLPMNRPFVTLKLATSLDGRIATASGESRWITGEAARAEVHKLRAGADAVMVGIGTAIADDPDLTARLEPAPTRQPLRVVMDHKLRLAATSRLAMSASERTPVLVMSVGARPDPAPTSPLSQTKVSIAMVRPAPDEGEMLAALRALRRDHGVESVLIEGGGVLAAAAIQEAVVDRIEWFRAPILLGGEGRPAVAALALSALAAAPTFKRVALRELGPDIWESYERC